MSGLSHLKMSAFCLRQTGVVDESDRDERAGVEAFGGAVTDGERRPESGAGGVDLSLTPRQVRRLQRRYEAKGAAGLVSGHRGKPSNRRLSDAIKQAVLSRGEEGLCVGKETLRNLHNASA